MDGHPRPHCREAVAALSATDGERRIVIRCDGDSRAEPLGLTFAAERVVADPVPAVLRCPAMTPIPGRGLFGSILCPVDFSTHSSRALAFAALVAKRSGGSVSAMFVNDPLLVAAAAAAYDPRALASRSRAELDRFARRAMKAHPPTKRVTMFVTEGQPAREIVKAARKLKSRLIVLGSEGLGGTPKLFFGSTTARVLAQAPTAVLAVPPSGTRVPKASWPGRRIVAAIGLGRHAARDVDAAVQIARWFDATLSLVHVVETSRLPGWLAGLTGGHDATSADRARAALERLAQRSRSAVPTDTYVLAGEPAAQVAAVASKLDAGLVIVALRRAPGFLGARQGSITYGVVREANTPVLALPPGWRP